MKKFTENFLLGEHSFGSVLRRIGLSMVVILMAVGAFAQAQETYHVWAEDVSDCYRYDNNYEVKVSMRDFVKIDEFTLTLEYNDAVFSYVTFDDVIDTLSGLNIVETTDGVLTMTWNDTGVSTIGETVAAQNAETHVFTLHFTLNGYPHAYGPTDAATQYVFTTDLEWDEDNSEVWDEVGQVTEILTDFTDDGSITATQGVKLSDITLTNLEAACDGSDAVVTITAPVGTGMEYSIDGSTFNTSNSTDVEAPKDEVTLLIRDGECVSYYYEFDVAAPEPLTYDADSPVYPNCPGGLGDITIDAEGGSTAYTYYVIPEADWALVTEDFGQATTKDGRNAVVAEYATSNHIIQREAGPEGSPLYYYVAVQDANECMDLGEDLGWWTMVAVEDTLDPWYVVADVDSLTCYHEPGTTFADGLIDISFSGATPYNNAVTEEYGYKIWVNNVQEDEIGWSYYNDDLVAGSYDIHVEDAVGCDWDTTIVVYQPDMIEFWADHTDASCNDSIGTITIDETSIIGGTGDHADYWWVYSTSPDFDAESTDTISVADGGVFTTAVDLAPGVYYVRVFDAAGCFDDFKNPNGDNALKVLTTEFEINYDPIECNGEATDVSIDITTGAGNHTFEYTMNGGSDWQDSNVFEDVAAGTYTFGVHDITIDCELYWTVTIEEPTTLDAIVIPFQTLPPSCIDNTDGNLSIWATGGTPFSTGGDDPVYYYKYKMDEGDWIQNTEYNTFAIDTAAHTVYIEDANGCTAEVNWPGFRMAPNTIDFEEDIYVDCTDDKVNLFNRYADEWECTNYQWMWVGPGFLDWAFVCTNIGMVQDTVFLDSGYLNYMSWYGNPDEHDNGTTYSEYTYWTSGGGFKTVTLDGVQQQRFPKFYTSMESGDPMDIVTDGQMVMHNTTLGAGTHYLVAMDEWGCMSNVDTVEIIEPLPLDITVSSVGAGCDGSTDGQIMIEALNGRYDIPGKFKRYEYVLTQQPQIFAVDNWVDQVTWVMFSNGDFANDSLAVIAVQEGTYWLAVRDYCGVTNTELIQFEGPIVIGGADAIAVDDDMVTIKPVTCVVEGEDTDYDGAITGILAATSGGFGDYSYSLDYISFVDYPELDGDDWPMENTSGDFTDLPGGVYELTIVDDSLGCMGTTTFTVPQPDPLVFDYVVVNPSCYDTHDGILRYIIAGGNAPYMEATNNVGQWEDPSDIPSFRWVDTSTEGVDAHGAQYFDRRVRAGSYQIWIKDSLGCIYGPVDVLVEEPAQLAVTLVEVEDVSCNDQSELNEGTTDDGTITVDIAGGWNMEDAFDYYVQLYKGSTAVGSVVTLDELDEVMWSDLSAGDYTVKLYEYNDTIYDEPIITYTDYFTDHEWLSWVYPDGMIRQNGTSACVATLDITVGEPAPITYDPIDWRDVKCHNTPTGEIYVPNITGGTKGSSTDTFEGYLIGLEGPVDYDATLQSDIDDIYDVVEDGIRWFETGTADEFTFDGLVWGHYTVHIKDINGCWIYKESGEIENPDTLQIEVVQLVEHALCYGGLGKIQIDAMGGVEPYMYAVDSTLVPNPGHHTFPDDMDVDAYLDGLDWQANDTFEVLAATWIGYVMDANGCVVGFATNENGAPIYHHRTTVDQADPVEAELNDPAYTGASCYAEEDGEIHVASVWGGNGGAWRIQVFGTDWEGMPVDTTYTSISSSTNINLKGLPASTVETDEDDMVAADWYTILVYDSEGCVSEAYYQYITQPAEFMIELKDKQNAFICPNDQAGLFEIETVKGGTAPFQYKWEVFDAEGDIIPELSDNIYGSVKTFLGYAGYDYTVYAIDANGCEATHDTFIAQPDEVVLSTTKITCYGDPLASLRVRANGTEGREFHVLYKEILNDVPATTWTIYADGTANEWFTDSVDIIEAFKFDNENLNDRHYAVMVEDTLGCPSLIDTVTFDGVQHELMVETNVVSAECTAEVEIMVTGGIPPYVVTLDGAVITEMTQILEAGSYTIKVTDTHLRCMATTDVDVVVNPVVRDTMVETYIGEMTAFMDVESGVDTMLAEGVHVLPYMYDGCPRTLNVTVDGIPFPATIIAIQGEVEASPMVDKVIVTSGTVTAVAPGEGFFMQDANAAWSGIWVAYSAATSGGIQVGNGVEVVGAVAEITDVTTINATEVMFVAPVLTVVPVIVASPADAENEMYESVLVTVEGARATAADAGNGEWTIFTEDANDVVVNDWLFDSNPTEGNYYDVTGVVNARLDAFKLEPRMTSDIVDLTLTGIDPTIDNVQFNVYPNPFNDRIMIDNNDKLTRVIVSNIAGQRVIDVEYPSHEIRTANLVSGVYVVSLITENGIAKTERIVKR